jgi:hypothetical protein
MLFFALPSIIKTIIFLMSLLFVIGNRLIGIRRFKTKEIPFREDFPCHSTWKRCKHSGHFSRFRNIIGNFCIIKQKYLCNYVILNIRHYPTSTRRHGNFAGVHTLLRILLSSNSAVLINIITGVSPPHFDFVVYYVLCQC